jgi:hypothetical protein
MYVILGILAFAILASLIYAALSGDREYYTSSSLANIGTLGDYRTHPPEAVNNLVGYDNMNHYGTFYNPFFPYVSGVTTENYERFTPSYDDELPTNRSSNEIKTLQRLDRIDKNLLPVISRNVTPYNIDVADPVTYTYQVHAPRVIRKDRLAMEADPVRGDIPISIYPDVPIIQRSQFNRDSLRLDGTFSEALAKTYDRLTGKTYFNTPISLSHGGMLM